MNILQQQILILKYKLDNLEEYKKDDKEKIVQAIKSLECIAEPLEDIKEVPKLKGVYASKQGIIYRIKSDSSNTEIKEFKTSLASNDTLKISHYINLEGNKKIVKTYQVHDLVYRTFKGDYEGALVFKDGNKNNCRISNLISIKELLEFYLNNQ